MNILVGTTNRNKVRSVQRYLQAYDVQLVTPQDVQLHVRLKRMVRHQLKMQGSRRLPIIALPGYRPLPLTVVCISSI